MQLELFETDRTRALRHLGDALAARLQSQRDHEAGGLRIKHARSEWSEIRRQLSDRVVGHEDLLDYLAMVVQLHRTGEATQRIMLSGPPGTGKSHIARAIAEVARCPFHVQDAQSLSESGWSSTSLEEILEAWSRRERLGLTEIARGVLVLDEIDKLRVHPEAHGNAIDKHRGSQTALLPLLGVGTPCTVGIDGRSQLDTRHMLVILAGAYSDATWGPRAPTAEELVHYGMLPELIDRVTDSLYVPAQPPHLLARLYAADSGGAVAGVVTMAERFGLSLHIEPHVWGYAATAVIGGDGPIGYRSGQHWIVSAARRVLVRAIREDTAPGTTIRVTPDDLEIPAAPQLREPPETDDGSHPLRSPR
jgi:hypothetical protein